MGSVFKQYYSKSRFIDRFNGNGVDVIVPIVNTNEFWRCNLINWYKVIPVNRLLVGDGGCTDDSIEIVEKFPRVVIVDQTRIKTLGFCIKKLIEQVETDWFVYLHSDVFLPDGWYDVMVKHQGDFDWFECGRVATVMENKLMSGEMFSERAYSGSQMGKRDVFKKVLPVLDDDYSQRNEDLIFQGLLRKSGGRYGKINDTFHYHQITGKSGRTLEEEIEVQGMQVHAIIKYLEPDGYCVNAVYTGLIELNRLVGVDFKSLRKWIKKVNPIWNRYINKSGLYFNRFKDFYGRNFR